MVRMVQHAWTCVSCLAIIAASFSFAWLLRFEFSVPDSEQQVFYTAIPIVLGVKCVVFYWFGVHRNRWSRYVAFSDLLLLMQANLTASAAAGLAVYAVLGPQVPRSIYPLDLLICMFATGGARFAGRLMHEVRSRQNRNETVKGLVIYGAGVAGLSLAREIRGNPSLGYRVLGFLDDDPRKDGARLLGLPVLGCGDDATRLVEDYRAKRVPVGEIVVAMPSATGRQIRTAVEKGKAARVPCRIVPSLGELISGKLSVRSMREISVTDLLGRDAVQMEAENVRRAVAGRVVMVTGAAGSIGSELCNQLAQFEPRALVALDQAETEMFRLEAELRLRYPLLTLAPEIGDIRDPRRMEEIIEEYGVDSIFHAAAYKHVPIMERHICEAVRNNVIGTWNLVQVAWRTNVSRFLLISSDKAVNPSSVMGLTKRIAELIVSASRPSVGRGPATQFVCVRFGNVLVSNGSVVPISRSDRGGWSGHGHASGNDAVFHDRAGSRATRASGIDDGQALGDFRAGYGHAHANCRTRAKDDHAGRPRTRRRHRNKVHRSSAGRENVRGTSARCREPASHDKRQDPNFSGTPACLQRVAPVDRGTRTSALAQRSRYRHHAPEDARSRV